MFYNHTGEPAIENGNGFVSRVILPATHCILVMVQFESKGLLVSNCKIYI